MVQYCRYCVWSCATYEDALYCEYEYPKKGFLKKNAIRNKCKHFEFNKVDAFYAWRGLDIDDRRAWYKPRNEYKHHWNEGEQISMEFGHDK